MNGDREVRYRRGVLLGLTLAEVMILLLFVILLATGVGYRKIRSQLDEANRLAADFRGRNAELNRELEQLRAENAAAVMLSEKLEVNRGRPEQAFADSFRELVLKQQELSRREEKIAALEEAAGDWKQIRNLASKSAKASGRPENDLLECVIDGASNAAVRCASEIGASGEGEVAKLARLGGACESLLKSLDLIDPASGDIRMEGLRRAADLVLASKAMNQTLGECREETRTSEAKLRKCAEKCTTGTGFPPCWINPDTGKEDAIFEVVIHETGIVVNEIPYERHAKERASLPIEKVRYSEIQNVSEFLHATRKLYEMNVKAQCRHFLRLRDQAESKNAFKNQLLALEGQFYKLLTRETSSP